MNDDTRVIRWPRRPRRPRRPRPATAPAAAVIIATAGLALPAGAFGSSPAGQVAQLGATAQQSSSSSLQAELAFSRCMRSHGVARFPDPNSNGVFPKKTLQQLGVSSSQLQAAQNACQHLLPNGGQPTPAALQQSWNDFRNFAQCMRGHDVPNWPDPTPYPQHPERPYFNLQAVGIDPNAPQISSKINACLPLLHGNNPQHLGQGGS